MPADVSLVPLLVRLWPIALAVVSWSVLLGLAAASRLGCDRARAVAVSVVLPVLGPAAVLVGVWSARRRRARRGAGERDERWAPSSVAHPVLPLVPQPVSPTSSSAGWFTDAREVVPGPSLPTSGRSSDDAWFPQETSVVSSSPQRLPLQVPAGPPAGPSRDSTDGRPAVRVPLLVCVLVVVPAALLLLAFFSSWGAVEGPVDLATPVLGTVPATAVPTVLCLASFLVAGVAMVWRAAGRWPVLAGTAALATLTTGVFARVLLELSDAVVDRVRRSAGAVRLPVDASVVPGDAVPLLISAGAAGLTWALISMALLDHARRRSPSPAEVTTAAQGLAAVGSHDTLHLEET